MAYARHLTLEAQIRVTFLSSVDEPLRVTFAEWNELGGALLGALSAAAEAWPGIACSAEDFARHVSMRVVCETGQPELPTCTGDLYLALGCLRGDDAAISHFEASILPQIDSVLKRFGVQAQDADDVRQELRERLLVGVGSNTPAIEGYMGSGALVHWVRAVASRQVLGRMRKNKPTINIEDVVLEDESDPQLAVLKERYRDEFKIALHAVVEELEARERTILRALIVDNRSVADIARLYRVHRVTASRWIAQIRRQLLLRTRTQLRQRLDLGPEELQSMIRMVESQMEMSLARLLEET